MFTPFAFVKQAAAAGGGFGPLTSAFIAATGVTGSVLQNALNDFETGLTTYSIATGSFYAIYPLVGGTSDTCKWNFVNTSQHPLSYTGSVSFSNIGIVAGGSPKRGWASTIPANIMDATTNHSVIYNTDNTDPTHPANCQVGLNGDIPPAGGSMTQYVLGFVAQGGKTIWMPNDNNNGQGNGSIYYGTATPKKAAFAINRKSASSMDLYVNTSIVQSNTTTLSNRGYSGYSNKVTILSRGQDNDVVVSQQTMGWASIGLGFSSDATFTDYITLVNNFQTAIGRNV